MNKNLAVTFLLAFAAPCSAQVARIPGGWGSGPALPPVLPVSVITGAMGGDPFQAVGSLEGSVHRPGGLPVMTSPDLTVRPTEILFLPKAYSRDEALVRRLETLGARWVDGFHLNDHTYRYSIEANDSVQAAAVAQALSEHYRVGVVLVHPSIFRRMKTEDGLLEAAKLMVERLKKS